MTSQIELQDQMNGRERLNDLATRPLGKLLWEYSLPAVVGMLVMSLYNVIDRIFIGQGVGSDAIAGLTITFPVMNLSAAVGVLVGAGAAARTSIMLGAHDIKGAHEVLGNSLVLILTNAVVYISLFAIFLDDILRLFGASDVTLPYARDFVEYILPGMLVMNVTFSFNNLMRATGYPVKAMIAMLIGAVGNVILAPIFIFWLDMGIKGAAIATDIAMAISGAFVMMHFVDKRSTVHFQRGIYRLKWHIVAAILSIGAAPSLINAATSAINALVNNSLKVYGDAAIAAAGIFSTFAALLCTAILGICQGMQPIVGYNYGAKFTDRAIRAYWMVVGVSSVISVGGSIFGMTCPDLIARMFTTDQSLIDVTAHAIKTTMSMFAIVGFQIVSTNFFQSIGKAEKSIVLSLSRQVIFLIPMLWLLPPVYGIDGVWYAFPASDVLATVITVILIAWEIKHIDRQNRHVRC